MNRHCLLVLGLVSVPAVSQLPDQAIMNMWEDVTVVHYEVVGVLSDKHVQIPPTDADLYADIVDKVTLTFAWDKTSGTFVGSPEFTNAPAEVSNLQGMDQNCPAGEINGAYEHFDIVSIKADGTGLIELTGQRVHPETSVAESCGTSRRTYAGAVASLIEYIAPPDPAMLAYRSMMTDGPVRISPDGKSFIMTALNNNWVWTFKPTAE